MRYRKIFTFVVVLSVLLAACGPGAEDESALGTQNAIEATLTALAVGPGPLQPTNTEQPSNTPLPPAPEATSTSSIPYVSVTVDTHCRSGPRIDYRLLTTILVGEQVEVLATFPGGNYVVVQRINGAGSCWLWLRYATQTDFSGYNLPVAVMPPTSTPTNTPTPTQTYTPSMTSTPSPTYTNTP